ncbi:MAG: hypothetical protein KC933_09655 [Myxococcales bacterium]|nr:hypothetical protein [Myxococcales bacterium]
MTVYLKNDSAKGSYTADIFAFVMVANISAALDDVRSQARSLSLTAKNARALAIRAGRQALGFKVITDFIDEFANKTIALASDIQRTAADLARLANDTSRVADCLERLKHARSMATEDAFHSLDRLVSEQTSIKDELDQNLHRSLRVLEGLLVDIINQMRAATFIAASSKVEAVSADDYRASLEAVAAGISEVAGTITASTRHCLRFIGEF